MPRSWAYDKMDETEFAKMVPQIRDYLLGDFLELLHRARQMGRQHGAAFSDGGGSMTKDERQYQARLRDYGCAICARIGMPGSPAKYSSRQKARRSPRLAGRRIPMFPTHHTELHANRRNYGAMYGIEEQALADEMRTRFMPMLRQSTQTHLYGRQRQQCKARWIARLPTNG